MKKRADTILQNVLKASKDRSNGSDNEESLPDNSAYDVTRSKRCRCLQKQRQRFRSESPGHYIESCHKTATPLKTSTVANRHLLPQPAMLSVLPPSMDKASTSAVICADKAPAVNRDLLSETNKIDPAVPSAPTSSVDEVTSSAVVCAPKTPPVDCNVISETNKNEPVVISEPKSSVDDASSCAVICALKTPAAGNHNLLSEPNENKLALIPPSPVDVATPSPLIYSPLTPATNRQLLSVPPPSEDVATPSPLIYSPLTPATNRQLLSVPPSSVDLATPSPLVDSLLTRATNRHFVSERNNDEHAVSSETPSSKNITFSPLNALLENCEFNEDYQPSSCFNFSDCNSIVNTPDANLSPKSLASTSRRSCNRNENHNITVAETPESSPVRSMSPSILKLSDCLNFGDFSDDDFDKDPDYIAYRDSNSSDDDAVHVNQPIRGLIHSIPENQLYNLVPLSTDENVIENRHVLDTGSNSNGQEIEQEHSTASVNQHQGRPKKGRKRKFAEYTVAERKDRKYKNLYYQTKNKEVAPKIFKNYFCSCKKHCNVILDVKKREDEFTKFSTLGSYEAQLIYIVSNVKETVPARRYLILTPQNKRKPRKFTRKYYLCGVEVCKEMFLKTLQISNQRITISLAKNRNNDVKDNRGNGGINKITEEEEQFIYNIISQLPKYESHYRRLKNSDTLYLAPGMTVRKIYELYLDEFKTKYGTEDGKKPVSYSKLKKVFYTRFNLRCKSLKKDTCNICDALTIKIMNAKTNEDRESYMAEKDKHLKLAEDLRQLMNMDMQKAKEDEKFECLTFDLEKTLPLPRIPTNIVFYKRQLWLYNCGIHAASKDIGFCYVWVEGEAGRGAQEVGSCLARHLQNFVDEKVENLVLWSDTCGGQNRNIKVVLMLKAILANHPNLKTITFKYLQSGHTFLPNDTDFSKIETKLKNYPRIYTPEEYMDVMKQCRVYNPLRVVRMESCHFFGTELIEKNIVNRKFDVNKSKINWLKMKEILIKSDKLHSLFTKTSPDTEDFTEINIEKKVKGVALPINKELLVPLWPQGKEIAQAKLDDINSLLSFIPDDCIQFYKKLKGNNNIIDDVDGYGPNLDFQLDIDLE